tara:strand:+ start:761 stop:1513 length:753 start_codon:yes stop_codon:yes gene_type:complete
MDNRTIFVCGTYDLIQLIGDSVINSSKKVIFISWDKPKKSTYKKIKIYKVENQKECEDFIIKKSKSRDDFLVSSYWPWKFSKEIVGKFNNNSVNFHPSPLPNDRGWFPHVHQIRKDRNSGVTLHVIDEKLDKGDIWVQKIVKLPYPITSGVAHDILKKEIVQIFNENWNKILKSKIKPKKQKKGGNFYSKYELDTPEIVKIKKGSSEDFLLRKIASRNFWNKSFIKIQIGNKQKFVHLEFSDDGKLEEER